MCKGGCTIPSAIHENGLKLVNTFEFGRRGVNGHCSLIRVIRVVRFIVGVRACKYAEFCLISCLSCASGISGKSEELPHIPRGTHHYMGLQTQPQEMGSSWRSMMRHLPE